jgi:hypothetical protein
MAASQSVDTQMTEQGIPKAEVVVSSFFNILQVGELYGNEFIYCSGRCRRISTVEKHDNRGGADFHFGPLSQVQNSGKFDERKASKVCFLHSTALYP